MDLYRIAGTKYVLLHNAWDFVKREPLGILCLWESVAQAKAALRPGEELKYSVAVDTSDGVGQDRAVVEVNRVGTPSRPDEQVAEWCGNVNPNQLPPIIYAICKLFEVDGQDPLLAIEVNRGDGTMVQDALMREYGYSNLFVSRGSGKGGNRSSNRYGWVTTSQTKPILWTRGLQWLKDHKWKINSPWFIEELADFGYNAARAEAGAVAGAHDDRLMAGFIALTCSKDWLNDLDVTATIEAEEAKEEKPKINLQTIDISAEEADTFGESDGWVYY